MELQNESEAAVHDFLSVNGLNANVSSQLLHETPEIQQAVINLGPLGNTGNPSSQAVLLQIRLRDVKKRSGIIMQEGEITAAKKSAKVMAEEYLKKHFVKSEEEQTDVCEEDEIQGTILEEDGTLASKEQSQNAFSWLEETAPVKEEEEEEEDDEMQKAEEEEEEDDAMKKAEEEEKTHAFEDEDFYPSSEENVDLDPGLYEDEEPQPSARKRRPYLTPQTKKRARPTPTADAERLSRRLSRHPAVPRVAGVYTSDTPSTSESDNKMNAVMNGFVQGFAVDNKLNETAVQALLAEPPEIQQVVISRGPLADTGNPTSTAVLLQIRIREAKKLVHAGIGMGGGSDMGGGMGDGNGMGGGMSRMDGGGDMGGGMGDCYKMGGGMVHMGGGGDMGGGMGDSYDMRGGMGGSGDIGGGMVGGGGGGMGGGGDVGGSMSGGGDVGGVMGGGMGGDRASGEITESEKNQILREVLYDTTSAIHPEVQRQPQTQPQLKPRQTKPHVRQQRQPQSEFRPPQKAQPQVPQPQPQQVDPAVQSFAINNNLNDTAVHALLAEPPEIQQLVINAGPLADTGYTSSTAILLQIRIRDAKRQSGKFMNRGGTGITGVMEDAKAVRPCKTCGSTPAGPGGLCDTCAFFMSSAEDTQPHGRPRGGKGKGRGKGKGKGKAADSGDTVSV